MFAYIFACISFIFPLAIESQPVLHVTHQQHDWYLDLRQAGFDGIDPTTLDRMRVQRWFYEIAHQINRPSINAHYDDNRNEVPAQFGKKVDVNKMNAWLDVIHLYLDRPLAVPYRWQFPRLTAPQLRELKGKLLSSYTTYYNNHMDNRVHNVELSTKAIDHHVVMPGEVFSFNQTVGQRTLTRGYREAKVIIKGEYSEGIGGGICQTSSTLFNSVDQANLHIVERISHSRRVPYVPNDRDATVSWGGPDFKFKNTYRHPILIVSHAQHGQLTVQIFTKK